MSGAIPGKIDRGCKGNFACLDLDDSISKKSPVDSEA
jgi:hypothetical protein